HTRLPSRPPLFPYTTLFRSSRAAEASRGAIPRCPQLEGQQRVQLFAVVVPPETVLGDQALDDVGPEEAISAKRGRVQRIGKQVRSEEHTSELQSLTNLVCRL